MAYELDHADRASFTLVEKKLPGKENPGELEVWYYLQVYDAETPVVRLARGADGGWTFHHDIRLEGN